MSGILKSIGGFFNRNRKKIFITSGMFGGIYLIGRFAKSKLIELQETITLDQVTRENIKKRFQRNQFDCLTTTSNFLPPLLEDIASMYNVEMLTARLQQSKNSNHQQQQSTANSTASTTPTPNSEEEKENQQKPERKTKIELWEELKIMSFTRLIASIYIINLIALLTFIQINLIGRYLYMDSVVLLNDGKYEPAESKNSSNNSNSNSNNSNSNTQSSSTSKSTTNKEITSKSLNTEIQAKYLAFCYHLLHVGWKDLAEDVNKIIMSEIGPLSLKNRITFESLLEIITKIRSRLEPNDDGLLNKTKYIINSEENDNKVLAFVTDNDHVEVDAKLKGLLNETRDILDSNDFSMVLKSCLNESFENLYLMLKPTFIETKQQQQQQQKGEENENGTTISTTTEATASSTENNETPVIPTTTKEIPLALLLPVITKSIYSVFYGVPNHFLNIIKDNMMQQRFSAIIYSSFENE